MYVVTNRNLQQEERPEEPFGAGFNKKGPNELRLAEVSKVGNKWQIDILKDRTTYNGEEMWASEAAFLQAQKRMQQNQTNALFFVHGFNTGFNDALDIAYKIEQLYNLEVILFTWPSEGREHLELADSYQDHKRDAALSIGALDRCLEKLAGYFTKYADQACKRKFSLAMHSMGNYLFKRLLSSSIYQGETLLFDNIVMLSADVNNHDHAEWVDRVRFRNRLFITINEDDFALLASKALPGNEQQARLGHWTKNLTARNATYLDFTDAAEIIAHHNYFTDESALDNTRIKELFSQAFNGAKAERGLTFDTGTGAYQVL
ncbi:MAG: alpha/beta hydrolase [Leptolyngbyaceae cyanobacterium MAG.088]|nr:alpha/beta hydrolase [Leptolyngbyaceae cyanobacterium MAG.088]